MTTISDPLPWAFELCTGCGRNVPLATHDLTCLQYDLRTRVAVAWICDYCDLVVGVVGLFTAWDAAIAACQRELDHQAASYFTAASCNSQSPSPSTLAETSSLNPAVIALKSAAANTWQSSRRMRGDESSKGDIGGQL